MTIEEMKKKKQELGYSLKQIAELSGLPLGTVAKIFDQTTKNPRHETLKALQRVFREEEAVLPGQTLYAHDSSKDSCSLMLNEMPAKYGTAKTSYTLQDYDRLPEDFRVELIDGKLYDMAAPSTTHQKILKELFIQLYDCEKQHAENCRVYLSPCDVILGSDRKTVVQPDLFVLCEPSKDTGKRIEGAPDFIIEITSESTIGKDAIVKLNKYMHSGVKEYWIVDPLNKAVLVYLFGDKTAFYSYTFEDKVPVHISGGRCIIDFSDIMAG